MDTATTIARDLVAEIGRRDALLYLARQTLTASTWRAAGQGVRLIVAVLAA